MLAALLLCTTLVIPNGSDNGYLATSQKGMSLGIPSPYGGGIVSSSGPAAPVVGFGASVPEPRFPVYGPDPYGAPPALSDWPVAGTKELGK